MNWQNKISELKIGTILKINPKADLSDWTPLISERYLRDKNREYYIKTRDSEFRSILDDGHTVSDDFIKKYFIIVR